MVMTIYVVRVCCYQFNDNIRQRRANDIFYKTGPGSVHLYVPILMYLYIIRIYLYTR